jgi:hypothetical protein
MQLVSSLPQLLAELFVGNIYACLLFDFANSIVEYSLNFDYDFTKPWNPILLRVHDSCNNN